MELKKLKKDEEEVNTNIKSLFISFVQIII